MIDRRQMLRAMAQGGVGTALAMLAPSRAHALGRTPVEGKLAISLPWPVDRIDPHDLGDPGAALFGHAIFDSLYALDAGGDPYPTLAADLPLVEGSKTTVRLREGLVTAQGAALDARDVLFAWQRAVSGGPSAWWGDLPVLTPHARDRLAIVLATTEGTRVARTLASPLFAIVPRAFDPLRPDGTGALAAQPSDARLTLRRNPNAARGPAFLEEITVEQAPDLSASLRSFEGKSSDIGWLGAGLHVPRPGARAFDFGSAAWIVLQTGNEAGPWGGPGVAQRLLDGLSPDRLQRFGLGSLPLPSGTSDWGGRPCELLVREGSAYMDELGRTLASLLSRPGHEVNSVRVPSDHLARRRAAGTFSLLLDIVRPLASSGLATLIALAAAASPKNALELMRRPPRLPTFEPRNVTRTLTIGVLGQLRVMGAHAPEVRLARAQGAEGWDLGSTYRPLTPLDPSRPGT